MEDKLKIRDWAFEDRPREKLMAKGIAALSDAELIAILIGSGNRKETAVDLSKRILDRAQNNLHELSRYTVSDLVKNFSGIGEAKAISIIAALELGRRRKISDVMQRKNISSPTEAADVFIAEIGDLQHEEFWVMMLSQSNQILKKEKVAQGGIAALTVDLRLLIKKVLDSFAPAIIIAHNHPSGNLKPSTNDLELTKRIKQATELMQIQLLDHLIVSQNNYLSFADEGYL